MYSAQMDHYHPFPSRSSIRERAPLLLPCAHSFREMNKTEYDFITTQEMGKKLFVDQLLKTRSNQVVVRHYCV